MRGGGTLNWSISLRRIRMNDNVEHRIGIMGSQELKPLQVSSQVWEPALSMLTTYENLSTKYNYDLIASGVILATFMWKKLER